MLSTFRQFWTNQELRIQEPWTGSIAIARGFLALAAGLTYLLTPASVLFSPVPGALASRCGASAGWMAWPCWIPDSAVGGAQLAAGALCLVVASGWFPAATAIPLALLLIALPLASAAPDGGDQLAGILGLLLVPVSLSDWRLHSWRAPHPGRLWRTRTFVAAWMLTLAKAQIAVVYLVACLGKLGSAEWADGTSLFYWVRNSVFGAPALLRPLAEWVTVQPPLLSALTWGTLVLEFTLAICVFLPTAFRLRALLPLALLFHLGIWLVLGVSSFAFVMAAALFILVVPLGWVARRKQQPSIDEPHEQETPA